MADPFRQSSKTPSRMLAEAAERLDRVVSIVKDQQLARTQSGVGPRESETFVLSPEEAWSKKYMIQCVGPVCTVRPAGDWALPIPRPAPTAPAAKEAGSLEFAPGATRPAKAGPGPRATGRPRPEPIGVAIGKPVRRRSWLGRLLRP
jgi:hypothetical protein